MINKANKSEYYHNDIQKIIGGGKYGKLSHLSNAKGLTSKTKAITT